jgi:uncharacterized protein YbjT (DUF2867 family)
MRALVTDAAGFIGSNVVAKLSVRDLKSLFWTTWYVSPGVVGFEGSPLRVERA